MFFHQWGALQAALTPPPPPVSLRQDLKETFIDSGVMTAIREWISPLPDKSLPALRIREELLRILMEVRGQGEESEGGSRTRC